MAEESDDSHKTEAPSQRRLDEARDKGQLVVSREVATLLLFGTATLLAMTAAPGVARSVAVVGRSLLAGAHLVAADGPGLTRLALALLGELGWPLLLPLPGACRRPGGGGRPPERGGLDRPTPPTQAGADLARGRRQTAVLGPFPG